jgi:uncharacterized protein YbjT (DUF2867 family)
MRLAVFGANGLTGRLLVGQALEAGHEVVAVTRHPAGFPISHPRLVVAEADVHDDSALARAVEGSGAVLSALGVPFTRQPVTLYSHGISNIVAAIGHRPSGRAAGGRGQLVSGPAAPSRRRRVRAEPGPPAADRPVYRQDHLRRPAGHGSPASTARNRRSLLKALAHAYALGYLVSGAAALAAGLLALTALARRRAG